MKKNGGFTLVEIVVSVAILAIVATLLAQVLFSTTHVNKKTELVASIKQNGDFALDVIARMVRSASSIQTTCDVGVATSVQIIGADGNVTTIMCDSGRIASVSAHPAYLTSDTVLCSALTFSCPPADGSVQKDLTVSFTLGQVGVTETAYESGNGTFGTTISLRN